MINEWGFDTTLHYKCNLFGKVFELSVKHGWDSKHFVKEVMTNKSLDWLFAYDDCQEWCDEYYFLNVLENSLTLKKGETKDKYFMWYLGYLYKYWMTTKNVSRQYVINKLPMKKFEGSTAFNYELDWEYIIRDVECGTFE